MSGGVLVLGVVSLRQRTCHQLPGTTLAICPEQEQAAFLRPAAGRPAVSGAGGSVSSAQMHGQTGHSKPSLHAGISSKAGNPSSGERSHSLVNWVQTRKQQHTADA